MGTNEQNQHFAELRQKVCLYTLHVEMLLRGLPSSDGILERFVTKSAKSGCQTRVRQTEAEPGAARIWKVGVQN